LQRDWRRFTVKAASHGEGLVLHAGAALLADAAPVAGAAPPTGG
jgi:hypothetical protein